MWTRGEYWKTLTCITTCTLTDNPTYIWYKNGHKVKEDTSSLYSDSFSDADSYSCAVKNHEDHHSPAVCLQVKVTGGHQDKTLTCITTCTLTDNPTYIWYKNGQVVTEKTSLYSVYPNAVDSYFCAVKGHEDLHSPAVYKPKTSVSVSPSGEIVEGSSVTLTCSSDANLPVQSYTWWYKKNGGDYQSMTGPQHVFSQIQSSDTGEYYCQAQNEMGTDRSRTINMDVKYGPRNTSVSVSPSGEIVEDSSVTLTCSSDANPPVDKYTWYKKNGASLTGSENTFLITNINSEDSGEYYCEAESIYGSLNSSSVSVDVQC
ncbi:B-cell receptor CD22-like [Salvelinus alpinus]|uniref:B-cell receptor CD22-like n=1 Tax=Salvelinus alpinus TaxID=8036 RepID=UPI0039FCB2CC